nr:hypothetical protein HK105_007581 [Polyrhizophydium stewartii]
MIGSGRFASLAVAAGAIFGAFSLACLTTVLVTRTTHFGNSRIWILAALVVSAIGWIVVVAGVAMSGGKPGLAAAPVVQYLQITVPGGLSCVAMLFVHFYGRCFSKQGRSEKRLEAPKTASKPSRFEFLKQSKETHIGGELHVDATSEAKESNATEVDDDAKTETKSEAGLSTSSVLPSTQSDESEQGDAESLLGPHKASRYLKRDEAALSLDDIDE